MNKGQSLVVSALLLVFALSLVWAGLMEEGLEGLSKLNTVSISEAYELAKSCYSGMNPRIGEFVFFFIDFQHGAYGVLMLIVHPLMVLLAVCAVFKLAVGHWPLTHPRKGIAAVTVISIFVAVYCIVDSHWFLGNFNWFYASSIALLFFCLLEDIFRGHFELSLRKTLLLIPMAVVVGMSNENTSIVSFFLYVACGICYLRTRGWKIVMKPGYIFVGCVLLLAVLAFYLSPARAVRSEYMHWELTPTFIIKNSILSVHNWLFFLMCFWQYIALYLIMICISRINGAKVCDRRDAVLWLSFTLLLVVLFAAPVWGAPRSFLPLQLVFVVIIARLLYRNLSEVKMSKGKLLWLGCSFLVICAFTAIPRTYCLWGGYQNWTIIKTAVAEAKLRGEQHVVVRLADFNRAPLMEKCPIPNFLFNYRCRPQIPLNVIDTKQAVCVDAEHLPNVDPWRTQEHHDVHLNKPVARRLGAKTIVCIK